MFDEDFLGCDTATEFTIYVDPLISDAKAAAAALDLPFDLVNIIDDNPFVYGRLGDGPLIGRTARFFGGTIRNLLGESDEVSAGIGTVVGHAFGRIVLAFEADHGSHYFIGWINPEDFELVYVHQGDASCRH